MASVYILFSSHLNRFYVGSCADRTYRIGQHLSKEFKASFTAKAEDWELFLFIDDLTYSQARGIEGHIKRMKSKEYIFNLKQYPDMQEKLKLRFI
jgi:putative endonuclease